MQPMLNDETGEKRIKEMITPMLGLPVMNVFSEIGSLFEMQLGQLEVKNGRLHSDWSFFFTCPWEIFYKRKPHVNSGDPRVKILDLIGILQGKTFLDIKFFQEPSATILSFDYGSYIYCYHSEVLDEDEDDDGSWFGISTPSPGYIVIGPGNYWRIESK